MGARQFEYFPAGSRPDRCGLEIVRMLFAGRTAQMTLYMVRMDCCGEIGELSHHQISARKYKAAVGCRICLPSIRKAHEPKKEMPKPDYGFAYPDWPKPPSVQAGHRIWQDRMK